MLPVMSMLHKSIRLASFILHGFEGLLLLLFLMFYIPKFGKFECSISPHLKSEIERYWHIFLKANPLKSHSYEVRVNFILFLSVFDRLSLTQTSLKLPICWKLALNCDPPIFTPHKTGLRVPLGLARFIIEDLHFECIL